MTTEEAETVRRALRLTDPRYCNQWNTPPNRYMGEHTAVSLQAKCGYPATWEVYAYGTRDFSCDVHLSQAVRAMSVLEKIIVIDVVAREFAEPDPA